jgi:hypothetical protein
MDKESFESIKRAMKDVVTFQKGDYRGAHIHISDAQGLRRVLSGDDPADLEEIRRVLGREPINRE